jgi:hypothetical protein
VARIKHIIKTLDFEEQNRSRITLGAGTRLLPNQNRLVLSGASGSYSLAPDLNVKTWSTSPSTLKRWVGFQADVVHKLDALGAPITDARFRLSDGTQELYWNVGAAAWIPAAPNNWNTEAEVANNIAAFPVANQTIQVVINLRTTNAEYTPAVTSLRLLAETDLEELEDYVWRSLLPDMKARIRPIGEHDIESDGALTIDLANDFRIETPYNIMGIDAVYDLATDPRKLVNLYSAYNPATKLVTLTSAPPAGNRIRIRFTYELPIAVNTHQDYIEVAKLPHIVFEDVDGLRFSEAVKSEYVINKATGRGKKVDASQSDIELTGRIVTDKSKDLSRIALEVRKYADSGLLRSVGQDELYRIQLLDETELRGLPSQQETRTGLFRLRIVKAVFYDSDAVDITGVLNFGVALMRATC